ncbi:hypothetical protein ACIBHX_01625 [Nonomuraea sp. NPDC050536]|uniref:hypothetical protein n=1 Tax=Nonomuraea sp. NPDC050536 TaxID=3364366 RepID=UPI0037CAAEB7
MKLEEIAPYPKREEDVTAAVMAKHHTAFALMHQSMLIDGHIKTDDRDRYRTSVSHVVAYYGIAHLLREIQGRAGREAADAVARDLWLAWEDGGSIGEWLWEWAVGYGIDPEAVRKVAAQLAAQAEQSGGGSDG